MTKLRVAVMVALFAGFAATAAQAQVLTSCVTRTVNANFGGNTWMQQHVCAPNEIAVSGGGFCSMAGGMIGSSTTQGRVDQDVWLWCQRPGPAVWYAMCCQQVRQQPMVRPLHSCVTRTVNAEYQGGSWQAQQVCAPNEIAVSGNGFCSQAGHMVGASTTKGQLDGQVWLQCGRPGPAVWYGMCCQP